MILQQGVGPTCFTASVALSHEIGKFTDVPARLEDGEGGDGWAGQFHHVAQLQPVVQPPLVDARTHPTTDGSKIVEALCTTMNFKGW